MDKVGMGPQTWIYPAPALLIGTKVESKANFMAAAWGGIANSRPPMISVAVRHQRYTHQGIRNNMTFSVNIPSINLVKEADYCGLASGAKVDKVEVCNFDVFYGKLNDAPLIKQCPVNHECRVVHVLNLGSHSLFIGKIEQTYVSEDCLTDGKPDMDKIKPFIYIESPLESYQAFGKVIARAFSIGTQLKPRG